MSVFQLLSCDIALGGDILNVVARHAYAPVTFPELLVLRAIHGPTAITNIYDVGAVERDDEDEMKRLCETYGAELVRERMFPGAGTRLPAGDNRYKPPVVAPKPAAAEPAAEVVLPAGSVDYAAPAADGPEAFVPSAEPTPAEDPFEAAEPAAPAPKATRAAK